MTQTSGEVRRRRVFYIPGYDPIPPRRYRELYRKEGAKQGEISGFSLSLSPKSGARFGWSVDSLIDATETHSEIDVLVWSDIVQSSMDVGIFQTYLILIRTAWIYISTGALGALMKLRRGPVLAALYPVAILLVQLLVAIGLGAVLFSVLGLMSNTALFQLGAGLASVALAYGVLRWFKKQDGKFFAYYLMHDYGYSARWRGAEPPELLARLESFQADIAEALLQDWDEVLVVGHSSGAHLGVSVLANLIRAGQVPEAGPKLAFLSLGQVVPMVSYLPDAKVLRRDLAYLSARDELFWLDVTAPGDPCSFALCDPVKVSGVAPQNQRWPLVISAAFTQSLSPELRATLKHRFFRLHFQYLCAFDQPLGYDYFQITAGPQRLSDRFADQAPTPSRIDTPANKYTEMAL
ncbi:SoxR reducing system RseC family protein [Pacificibacter sp.]|uniref:SoxR reducing system RseC family protein n=1 Tax=Pacificibacter sp. TaxID=1917866 RepID=UPI00321AF9A4